MVRQKREPHRFQAPVSSPSNETIYHDALSGDHEEEEDVTNAHRDKRRYGNFFCWPVNFVFRSLS